MSSDGFSVITTSWQAARRGLRMPLRRQHREQGRKRGQKGGHCIDVTIIINGQRTLEDLRGGIADQRLPKQFGLSEHPCRIPRNCIERPECSATCTAGTVCPYVDDIDAV